MNYIRIGLGLALLALFMAACGPVGQSSSAGNVSAGRYASNGERIYFTATSANGPISYTGGPSGGMMGGRGMTLAPALPGSRGTRSAGVCRFADSLIRRFAYSLIC
jgi:hypothetical protein